MNAIALQDLNVSKELDQAALAEVLGGGSWHKISSSISTGSWSSYSRRYQTYIGTTFHDGYLARKYREGWKRTRKQTEYSTWYHYVRV